VKDCKLYVKYSKKVGFNNGQTKHIKLIDYTWAKNFLEFLALFKQVQYGLNLNLNPVPYLGL
jgi:hypothetical protein